jgi:hypothetical protein
MQKATCELPVRVSLYSGRDGRKAFLPLYHRPVCSRNARRKVSERRPNGVSDPRETRFRRRR